MNWFICFQAIPVVIDFKYGEVFESEIKCQFPMGNTFNVVYCFTN